VTLTPGTRLGPYEVVSPLGAGGMGEVWKARDTKLNREVALKILPEAFALDADRLARFKREAQVLASLNHPHIGAIYGFEDSDGIHALVLELVDGPTLADRIAQGPIPLDDALPIAKQIVEALEAAHEQGIIHRDLKPANIKLTAEGSVKVLDFGLAKLVQDDVRVPSPLATAAETIVRTRNGLIVGTPGYMSPEQLRGHAIDRRADIWGFGCVMYEMLTGRCAFRRETSSDTLAAILEREPDWQAVSDRAPAAIQTLIRRCLQKNAARRLRDIGDVRLELEDALSARSDGIESSVHLKQTSAGRRSRAYIGGAAIVGLLVVSAAATTLMYRSRHLAIASVAARFTIPFPPAAPLTESLGLGSSIAISRDGRRLAFLARPRGGISGGVASLYVRDVDQLESRAIPGTSAARDPFFSPDGTWVGFFVGTKLEKVSVDGGAPVTICETQSPEGGTWSADGMVFFTPARAGGIWRVPAEGGTPVETTKLQANETAHRWPHALPDGRALLFTSYVPGSATPKINIQSLTTGERRVLLDGTAAHYVPTGHLVFARGGTLMAAPFDAARQEITGAALPFANSSLWVNLLGVPHAGVADNGTLAYLGEPGAPQRVFVWVDRAGVEQPIGAPPGDYVMPRLSPDATRVAYLINTGNRTGDAWLYDLARNTPTRLTFGGNTGFLVWRPDGQRLTYTSTAGGEITIASKPVDGSESEETLLAGNAVAGLPLSWSPNGRSLAMVRNAPTTLQDLWIWSVDERAPRLFLQTPFAEGGAVFSPDGRWLAYVSTESGESQVYIRSIDPSGQRYQVSNSGGNEIVWPRRGHELFYRRGDSVIAVDVMTEPQFSVGRPRQLFDRHYERSTALWANYDVSSDGRRLLMMKPRDESGRGETAEIYVTLNWFEELNRRLPAKSRQP